MSAQPADAIPYCSIGEAMYRVSHWWGATRGGVNLGFSRRTMLGKVIEEGAQGASHERGSPPPTWMAPADEEVDRILARMPRELREAIVLDQQRGLPMKAIAAKLNSTPAEVRRWIENGYGFIAGVLTANASSARSTARNLRP